MKRAMKRRSKKAGMPPGSLVHIGEPKTEQVCLSIFDYNADQLQEKAACSFREFAPLRDQPTVTWVNMEGVHEVELLKEVGESYSLHPLVMEDILNTDQRPKLEDYGDYLYVVFKMLTAPDQGQEIISEQISLVIGRHFVLSFQEGAKGDLFDPIRERLRSNKGRLRKAGADYLAYSLADAVVDNYFIILEKLGEQIELLEEELVTSPTQQTLTELHRLKMEMLLLRKSVWPLREVVSGLSRVESELITGPTKVYLKDLYDHTIQVIDTIEIYREMLSGMLDIYLSSLSNRLNEVMKVLTMIATIFIPLTFVAGIYGMNFEFMPEIHWRFGYLMFWAIILAVGGIMLYFFRKKKWL